MVVFVGKYKVSSYNGIVGILGRFQPFHWGHFEYLLEASIISTKIIVGITNPDKDRIRYSTADLSRSKPGSNPFTFLERREMILSTIRRYVPHISVDIVPCDLRSEITLRQSMGKCDTVAITKYDEWSEERMRLVIGAGYKVTVLWCRDQKITSGTEIRERMRLGGEWEHLVPYGTRKVITSTAHFK